MYACLCQLFPYSVTKMLRAFAIFFTILPLLWPFWGFSYCFISNTASPGAVGMATAPVWVQQRDEVRETGVQSRVIAQIAGTVGQSYPCSHSLCVFVCVCTHAHTHTRTHTHTHARTVVLQVRLRAQKHLTHKHTHTHTHTAFQFACYVSLASSICLMLDTQASTH